MIANGNEAVIIRGTDPNNDGDYDTVTWQVVCDCGAEFPGENALIAFGLWLGHDANCH